MDFEVTFSLNRNQWLTTVNQTSTLYMESWIHIVERKYLTVKRKAANNRLKDSFSQPNSNAVLNNSYNDVFYSEYLLGNLSVKFKWS